MIGQETCGPGGMAYGLRSCKDMIESVHQIREYAPDAWIDTKKTKVGYEIPMTRYFYEYQVPEPLEDIMERITGLEADISESLQTLFHKEA